MKKIKLFLAAVAAMVTMGVNAQGWTAQTPADGDFYLYNVGTGKFLSCGEWWGSFAVVDNGALKFTLKLEDGKYRLFTTSTFTYVKEGETENTAQLQYSGYVDQSETATTWAFAAVDGLSNTYTLQNSTENKYIVAPSNGDKTISLTETAPSDNYGYWKLINYANLFPKTASAENPVDVTCLVGDANFESSQDAMKAFWTMVSDNKNLCGGAGQNHVAESYRKPFTLSQIITVPNGYYRLRAQTFVRDYAGTGANFPVVYISSGAVEKTTPFIAMNTETADLSVVSGYFRNGDNGTDYFTAWTDVVTVTNGSITVGAKGTRDDTWCAFDNFQLQYLGAIDLSGVQAELAAAVSAAEATNGTIPTAAYNAIAAVVTEQNKSYSTVEEYTAAKDAIYAAISAYASTAIVDAYAGYMSSLGVRAKAITTKSLSGLASSDVTTLDGVISTADAAVNACTTAEALATARTTQEANLWAAIGVAINTIELTGSDELDLTYLLTNPDVTSLPSWKGAEGWYTEQTEGNSQVMNNDAATSEDGTKTKFYEYWTYTAQTNGKFALYQKVTLPEGTYSIGCYAFAKQQDDPANTGDKRGVIFYANDTPGSAVYNSRLTENGIDFINDAAQEVKIGLKTMSPNSYNWMGIGYVTLKKVAASTTTYAISASATNGSVAVTVDDVAATEALALKTVKLTVTPDEGYVVGSVTATYNDGAVQNLTIANPSTNVYTFQMPAYDVTAAVTCVVDKSALNAAIAAATAARVTAYEGSGVFQRPTSAGETFAAAIATAQGVYDNASATVSEVATAVTTLENAQATYQSAINAPTPGQAYIVANTTASGVLKVATESVTVDANAAIFFTAVEGGYVISNANDEYIFKTTGNTWTLSTTTNESDAYVITSVNPVDGGFTIQGARGLFGTDATDAGSAVYANKAQANNGVWTISEATTVNMKVAAGKWGTFIAPFDVIIPENVSAYTATGVNNNKVTVEAVETTIPANTPVLLKNDGEDLVEQTFYGISTATKDSYTVGLLTGVYTAATIPASSGNTTNYVLQTQADGQAFYTVGEGGFTATAYKCYLTVTSESPVKAFFLDFGGEDTINGIEAETENAEIFNLAGQRVNKAQRGIYIINGKKVLVK